MAIRLLKRVRRRHRYEVLKRIRSRFRAELYRWAFLTQWKATFLASVRARAVIWIGRGFNPDYTQACAGSCVTTLCPNFGSECWSSVDCRILDPSCDMGACDCPAPLAHSTEVSNSCTCQASGYKCTTCALYGSIYVCTVRNIICPCGGTCGYNCDVGYSWNGSACVAVAVKQPIMDGLIFVE